MKLKEVFKRYWLSMIAIIIINSILMRLIIKLMTKLNIDMLIQSFVMIFSNLAILIILSSLVILIDKKIFIKGK